VAVIGEQLPQKEIDIDIENRALRRKEGTVRHL
jgi:hypothetical protein